jgi:hypothetical protein
MTRLQRYVIGKAEGDDEADEFQPSQASAECTMWLLGRVPMPVTDTCSRQDHRR